MESTQLQQEEPQQERHLVGLTRQPPLSPIEEEAVTGLACLNKRARENPINSDDNSNEERGVKRRQSLVSHDGVESAAQTTVQTAVEDEPSGTTLEEAAEDSDEQAEGLTNEETTQAIVHAANEIRDREMAHRRRVLAAYIEKRDSQEASHDDSSAGQDSAPDPNPREAINGNPSTRYTSPQPDVEPSWRDLHDGSSPARPHYLYPISEADSDCFALPRCMWPKENKSDPYRDPSWENDFQQFGTFMHGHPEGLRQESETLCKELLEGKQPLPEDSLFGDDIVAATCKMIQHRSETMVFRDITPLIAPSAEVLSLRGKTHIGLMSESTNEEWSFSQPILRIQPQPVYAVGFQTSAFSLEQYYKIYYLFEGRCKDNAFSFASTQYMFFPFFSCEIGPLSMAQRQNTHNMTIGMHGIVELFRSVKREAELHRQVLAFSISHNHREAQIVAHYPVILGEDTSYFQQIIHSFDFSHPDCADRWAAYRFTRNIYDHWMPKHHERVCSAIDDIPRRAT